MNVQHFNPSTFTYYLKQADDYCDYVPLVSTISEICDLFLKCMISLCSETGLINKTQLLKNYYWAHIHHKEITRCLWGLIPVIGNKLIWDLDTRAKDGLRNEDSDLFVHTVQEARPAERPALARDLYNENRNDFYANVTNLRLHSTDLVQIPLAQGTREEAEDLIRNIHNMPLSSKDCFELAKKCVDLAPDALGKNLHTFSLTPEQNDELTVTLFDRDPDALIENFQEIFLRANARLEMAKKYLARSVPDFCAMIDKFKLQTDATATIVDSLMENPQENFPSILENMHKFTLDDKSKVKLMEYYKGTVSIEEFCQNIGRFKLSSKDALTLVNSLLEGRLNEDANLRLVAANIDKFHLSYDDRHELLKSRFKNEYDYLYRPDIHKPFLENLDKFKLETFHIHELASKLIRHAPVLLITHWGNFFPGEAPESVLGALPYFFTLASFDDSVLYFLNENAHKFHLTPAIISAFIDDTKNYLGTDDRKPRIIRALVLCCPEAAPDIKSRLDKFGLSDEAKAILQPLFTP